MGVLFPFYTFFRLRDWGPLAVAQSAPPQSLLVLTINNEHLGLLQQQLHATFD